MIKLLYVLNILIFISQLSSNPHEPLLPPDLEQIFLKAIAQGNLVDVAQAINKHTIPSYVWQEKALIVAVVKGQMRSVQYLIERGANIYAQNERALYCAVLFDRCAIVQLLLKAAERNGRLFNENLIDRLIPLAQAVQESDIWCLSLQKLCHYLCIPTTISLLRNHRYHPIDGNSMLLHVEIKIAAQVSRMFSYDSEIIIEITNNIFTELRATPSVYQFITMAQIQELIERHSKNYFKEVLSELRAREEFF